MKHFSRRDFIHASCAIAAASFVPSIVDRAEAGLHLHGSTGSIVPLANRKVQVGLNAETSTYKNLIKNSFFGAVNPLDLNVDLYPTGVISANIALSVPFPTNVTNSTVFTVAWTGTVGLGADTGGGLSISGNITVVSDPGSVIVGATTSSMRMAGTNGVVTFRFNSTSIASTGTAVVFANGANFGSGGTQFRNLILCVGDTSSANYTALTNITDPSQVFNVDYINAVKGLSPKTIRCLGFIGAAGMHTQHRYRLGWNTALTFGNTYFIPNAWAGVTRAGSNITNPAADGLTFLAAAATDSPVGAYVAGEVIQGQFAVNGAGSGAVTINIASRGAVPVFAMDGFAYSPSNVHATAYGTFFYDDILQGFILSDAQGYGWEGSNTPLEILAGLANAVGCNLWYQMNAHNTWKNSTMEGGSNSVAQQAALLSSTLTNGCYAEIGNEIWNNGAGFGRTTSWCDRSSIKFGQGASEPDTDNSFYGYMLATRMPIFKTAWGVKSGLVRVAAFQLGVATGDSTDLNRLQGKLLATSGTSTGTGNAFWGTYTSNANYTASPNRPVDCVESLSYAPYYNGAQIGGFDTNWSNVSGTGLTTGHPTSGSGSTLNGVIGAADAYKAGGATNITNAIAWVDWDIRQGTNAGDPSTAFTLANLSGFYNFYGKAETVAASYDAGRPGGMSALRIDPYEGANGAIGLVQLCSAHALGLDVTTTATIATGAGGSGTQIGWTAHGLDNGAVVGFNVSLTDIGSNVFAAYPILSGQRNTNPVGYVLYVVNALANSFDISTSPGGTPMNIASVGVGTRTAWGSNYCGGFDRIQIMLNAYKQSSLFQATVQSQFDTMFATGTHMASVVWFTMDSPGAGNAWTMYGGMGDVYSTPRFTSYDAVAAYHS